jgi:hypothetical protein
MIPAMRSYTLTDERCRFGSKADASLMSGWKRIERLWRQDSSASTTNEFIARANIR